MKLKTLNYIHALLIQNEEENRNKRLLATDARNKAEDEHADNYMDLYAEHKAAYKAHIEASDVLRDFEDHDWR